MGNRVFKRVLAVCLAMVLSVASSLAVMATETTSPGGGDVIPDPVIPNRTTSIVIKSNSIEVSYTQQNAVRYRVEYKSTDGTWSHCKVINTTNLKAVLKNLVHGGKYDIRIVGINEKGKTGTSKEANRFFRSCAAKVTSKNGKINVKVSKELSSIGSETQLGYKTYWSTDPSFKKFNTRIDYGTTLDINISAKKGTTYYVRVVPICVANGKTYAGVQNSTHEITVK
jgi:hypothetical protein